MLGGGGNIFCGVKYYVYKKELKYVKLGRSGSAA